LESLEIGCARRFAFLLCGDAKLFPSPIGRRSCEAPDEGPELQRYFPAASLDPFERNSILLSDSCADGAVYLKIYGALSFRALTEGNPMLLSRAVLALGCVATFSAQAADPALFQDLHWRLVGPFRGGRTLAVAGVPDEPQHYYFGSVNGGVWETLDAGRTWQPIFDSQPVGSIGAIAIAPSAPHTIYVGTGEADMRSDIAQGGGVYKSTDGGKTWKFSGLGDSQQIARILVDPRDASRVYLAALGHPYGANAERGVFRSRDGGTTWSKVLGPNADTGAIDLIFQPGNADVIYAALWQTRRPPWNVYPPAGGPSSGLYKSTDGGEHWSRVSGKGFPDQVGRIGLAISAAAPQRIYALVDGDSGGLYRSDDAGASWTRKSTDVRIWQRDWYFGEITADPQNPDRVYVPNTIVLRSDDGGTTFDALKGDWTGDDFHTLWIDPKNPQRQMLGIDQGAIVTLNGGATWSSWHNQPTAQIYHVSTDNRFPYWIYGAQQDSGAIGLPSRSRDGNGISMMQFREMTVGGEADNIAPDPDDPQIVFGGRVDRLDLRTEQVRHVDPTLAAPDIYRRTWTLPLTFSPRQPHVLYFANQRLFRTTDRGEHWEPISPDLTRPDPGVPANLNAVTADDNVGQGKRRGVIYAIAPSPVADGLIWVGSDDGLIWRTRDGGAHWDDVRPKDLTPWSKIGIIDASAFAADSAYVAVDRHRLDDQKPYIYRTHDGGRTWQVIVAGLPRNESINVVRADPQRQGLLFAGSERSVYVSFDDGAHWQPLKQNLPPTSVRDITIHDRDLVIATHGRGIWVLDDISSLRQLDAAAEQASAWLFAPAPAYRLRVPQFTGTPLPKDEPLAANPPVGAVIEYTLKTAAKAPLTLEIFDGGNELVRRYSSAEPPPPPDPKKNEVAPEWTERPIALSNAPGMHRFVWPLQYAPLPTGEENDPYAKGLLAPPGTYRVVLSVDGERLTRTLRVLADPRVDLSAETYAHQFALARRVDEERARVARAAHEAETLLTALKKLRAENVSLTGDIDELATHAHALAGTRATANAHNAWAYPPRDTKNLAFVGGELENVLAAVDGADAEPSVDARHGFEVLAPLAAANVKAWDDFKARDVAAFNAKLRAAGKPEVKVTDEQSAAQ
jgi:photosystem II stability/assembly factor-like uncharacterized protein